MQIRFTQFIIGLLFIITLITPIAAQDAFLEYQWQEADIALRYPADWDDPLALFNSESGANVLQMAQDFVTSPNRPPAIPIITLMLIPDIAPETDLYGLMETELQAIDIRAIGPIPGTLLEQEAIVTNGTDRNSILFGLGRIIIIDDGDTLSALLMIGRASTAQRDTFTTLFTNVANSLVLGANRITTAPEYGVLWHTESLPSDSSDSFVDIRGLTRAPNGDLLLLDSFSGILTLDGETGSITDILPIDAPEDTSSIAVDADGTIYIGDLLCGCIRVFAEGEEVDELGVFNLDAPRSIVIAPDGTLYATDINEEEVVIHSFIDGNEDFLIFEIPLFEQPFLAIDQLGQLLVLADSSAIYTQDGAGFSFAYDLDTDFFAATAMTVNHENHLVIATEQQGILVFDDEGNEINRVGRIVAGFPLAGELLAPQGVATAPDGTLFWADSDGSFGNVTAVSLSVEGGRVGGTKLRSGVPVGGEFTDETFQQTWAFDGLRGERVTLTAVAGFDALNLDLALRLLAPDGDEVMFVDNDDDDDEEEGLMLNPFDPQIVSFELPQDGEYTVIVEAVIGTGRYQMGLSKSQNLDFVGGELVVQGLLSEVLPIQEWILEGRGGQSITITLEVQSGSLDPILFVLNPRSELIAENDDAEDSELGLNSQIVDLALPQNGQYIIQASRFFGEGTYRLTIVQN